MGAAGAALSGAAPAAAQTVKHQFKLKYAPHFGMFENSAGKDLIDQLKGAYFGRALLIPRAMLKADEALFLDGVSLAEAESTLHTRILPVASGEDLIEILFSE